MMNRPGEPIGSTRREFLQFSGLALGASAVTAVAAGGSPAGTLASGEGSKPDEILARLMAGNERFVKGELLHPGREPSDFLPLAKGQAPQAIIIGCADSRVAPEILFDQGKGDLFVVRVAGNVVAGGGPFVKGSVEFAVAELGARLIMVLGHEACGAVKAAVAHIDANDTLPGAIRDLVEVIRPAAASVRGKPGDKVENAIEANVRMGVERLNGLEPILAGMVKKGEVKIIGAVYELKTGKVRLLD